ncbi:diguanylate cyclase [Dapis sp. BLCC M126]|uniref:GGDEF domain-containing protein n=1 Tax=Dapis sp. BLCC M126 TaxID=3400189 RepID=UPI003CF32082
MKEKKLKFINTIKFRMLLVFALTIGLLLLITTSSVIVMQVLKQTVNQFLEQDLPRVERTRKLNHIIEKIASDAQRLAETKTKYSLNQTYKQIDSLLMELEDMSNTLSKNRVNPDIIEMLLLAQQIRSKTQLAFQLMGASLELDQERLILKNQLLETSVEVLSELQTTVNQLVQFSNQNTQGIIDDFEQKKNTVFQMEYWAIIFIIVVSIIVLGIVVVMQWQIVERGFSQRLEIISQSLARVPKTSEETKIPVVGNDEIAFMARRLEKLLEKALQIQLMATTDDLTQVANRRYFFQQVEIEIKRARRSGREATVLLLDIDFFKTINDTYGHDVGDIVLKTVAHTCKNCLRITDILARIGGEEFAIFSPETNLEHGQVLAERIRQMIEMLEIELFDSTKVKVTISLGVAKLSPLCMDINRALKKADSALYSAKKKGRNQVVVNFDL